MLEFRLPAGATIGTKLYAIGGSGATKDQETAGVPAHWNIYTLDMSGSTGLYTSVAVADNGNAHISYYSETDQNIKYIELSGNTDISGSILIDTLVDSSGDTGLYTSISTSRSSPVNTYISYYM